MVETYVFKNSVFILLNLSCKLFSCLISKTQYEFWYIFSLLLLLLLLLLSLLLLFIAGFALKIH